MTNDRQRFKDQTALLADLAEHSGDAEFHDIDGIRAELLHEYDELRARVEALTEAHQRCCDETDYCYVCDNHPSHGHAKECPLAAGVPVEKQP